MSSKIRYNYIPEFYAFLFGRRKPSVVTVNLTDRCNQCCIYCEIGANIPSLSPGVLTRDDMFWIIDEMKTIGIHKISLCGGEPLLFEPIFDVISYAWKSNIRSNITTNGMILHGLSESELNILKCCTTQINISIDSFDEDILAYTRGTPAALQNALKSIEVLNEHRIPLILLSTISKYNVHDLYQFVVQANEKGIGQVLFQPVIYFSNYPDRPAIANKSQLNVAAENLDLLMEQFKKILTFEKKHNFRTNVYRIVPWIEQYLKTAEHHNGEWFFEAVLNKFYCRDLYAFIDITYNGGIQPCCLSPAVVNIHENKHIGLKAMWLKATEKIRQDIGNNNYYPCCNGCCHHFGRNMLASIMKYPFKNRKAFYELLPLMLYRMQTRMIHLLRNNL